MVMDWLEDNFGEQFERIGEAKTDENVKRNLIEAMMKRDMADLIVDMAVELKNTAKDPVGQFQRGIEDIAQIDAVQDFIQTKQNLSNISNRLQMADILRLAQTDPQDARQAYIDFQLRSGTIPNAPPTRGSIDQGGSEIESPEDWWRRNKGKR